MDVLRTLLGADPSVLALVIAIGVVWALIVNSRNQTRLIELASKQDDSISGLSKNIEANTKATEAQTKAVEASDKLTKQFTTQIERTGDRVQQLHDAVIQQGNDQTDALKTYSQEIPKAVYANSQALANNILNEVRLIPDQIGALSGKIDAQTREIANARGIIEQAPEAITVMIVSRLSNIIGTTQQELEQLRTDVRGMTAPPVVEKQSEA